MLDEAVSWCYGDSKVRSGLIFVGVSRVLIARALRKNSIKGRLGDAHLQGFGGGQTFPVGGECRDVIMTKLRVNRLRSAVLFLAQDHRHEPCDRRSSDTGVYRFPRPVEGSLPRFSSLSVAPSPSWRAGPFPICRAAAACRHEDQLVCTDFREGRSAGS